MKRDRLLLPLIGWAIIILIILGGQKCQAQYVSATVGLTSRHIIGGATLDVGTNLLESRLGKRLVVAGTVMAETAGMGAGGYLGYEGSGNTTFAGVVHFNHGKGVPMNAAPHLLVGFRVFDLDDFDAPVIDIRYIGNFRQDSHCVYLTFGLRIGR